jgi:hypothetical protein
MTNPVSLPCDGCGQLTSSEHIARRLQRLEWTTRYRPVHINALLLGGISPTADGHFLYSGRFEGEAGRLLEAVGISTAGKSAEAVLVEFQRGGFFLTHVLECPLENKEAQMPSREELLSSRLPQVMARIRRSLKPKRVVLISELLATLCGTLSAVNLRCPVVLDDGEPFGIDSLKTEKVVQHLTEALRIQGSSI